MAQGDATTSKTVTSDTIKFIKFPETSGYVKSESITSTCTVGGASEWLDNRPSYFFFFDASNTFPDLSPSVSHVCSPILTMCVTCFYFCLSHLHVLLRPPVFLVSFSAMLSFLSSTLARSIWLPHAKTVPHSFVSNLNLFLISSVFMFIEVESRQGQDRMFAILVFPNECSVFCNMFTCCACDQRST